MKNAIAREEEDIRLSNSAVVVGWWTMFCVWGDGVGIDWV